MVRRARIVIALAALMTACSPASDGSMPITRPIPAEPGKPVAGVSPTRLVVPPGGGALGSPDGQLTISVPPGAVTSALEVSIEPISNTAPRGLGHAYRVEPSGQEFEAPVSLTFAVPALASVESVGVAYQDAVGYWVPVVAVLRNPSARLVTVSSTHFSDWALIPADPTRDMTGSFTITSSVSSDAPFTAVGNATLSFVGEDAVERGYILGGTLTLQTVTYQGNACTPDAQTRPITPNLVEAFKSPARLAWGTSGLWNLSCGPSTAFVELVFDSYGISHLGCARGETVGVSAPVTTADVATGDYTIDCSAAQNGTMRASWSFQRCGGTCVASRPCATSAAYTCTASGPVCTVLTTAAAGTPCTTTTGAAGACDPSGTCIACDAGGACTPPNPCMTGTTPVADATVCDASTNAVCLAGVCSACTPGVACVPASPCNVGTLDCGNPSPVPPALPTAPACIDTGVPVSGTCP